MNINDLLEEIESQSLLQRMYDLQIKREKTDFKDKKDRIVYTGDILIHKTKNSRDVGVIMPSSYQSSKVKLVFLNYESLLSDKTYYSKDYRIAKSKNDLTSQDVKTLDKLINKLKGVIK